MPRGFLDLPFEKLIFLLGVGIRFQRIIDRATTEADKKNEHDIRKLFLS